MRYPFSDITLYAPSVHPPDTPEYRDETFLQNFVCDLYVQRMNGYKPPNTSRVTLQPGFYGVWNHPWKNGSIVAIAPAFSREEFDAFDTGGKYRYVLETIQWSMLQLCNEYHWDVTVFERAYDSVLASKFVFRTDYPSKLSRDRKHSGGLRIEKTETLTTVSAVIRADSVSTVVKLLDKKNWWCMDSVYQYPKFTRWFDSDNYGLYFPVRTIEIRYSIKDRQVYLFKNGHAVTAIDFNREFEF